MHEKHDAIGGTSGTDDVAFAAIAVAEVPLPRALPYRPPNMGAMLRL